ncbi:MAG: hypothetical protein H5T68_08915 [Chloroflexi bacterium]|nr:hypothetical protein [Chloroflexota bacterium]
MGLFSGKLCQVIDSELWLLVIGAVLTAVSGTLLCGPNVFGTYWPVLLIALGTLMLMLGLTGRGN